MRTWDRHALKTTVVDWHRRRARYGVYRGDGDQQYLSARKSLHAPTGTLIIFTRDLGHHTSGWWKNPDYERCCHLSLSFVDPLTLRPRSRDVRLTKEWVELFFGSNARSLWCEPPYSPDGQRVDVWHYRLFCDPSWAPILPRGEVYSKDWTPAGWKSWSDVQHELATPEGSAP